jgi:DNA-binding transcriptional ArsR family regulator
MLNPSVEFSRQLAHSDPMEAPAPDLDLVFAALADPTRRAILSSLLAGERTVGALAQGAPLSLAAVSKHVQILARAGLVSQRRAGRERRCRLEPDAIAPALVWMRSFGGWDPADEAALERLLEALGSADGLDPALGPAFGAGEVD